MASILKRLWARLPRTKNLTEPDRDWKTTGKSHRPSGGLGHGSSVPPNYVPPADEGRPPH